MPFHASRSQTVPERSSVPVRPASPQPDRAGAGRFPAMGNQALQKLLLSRAVQAKLTVSQPGDPYEQEADRVADEVMRMPEPGAPAITSLAANGVQRKCAGCEAGGGTCAECAEEEEAVQREASGAEAVAATPHVEARVRSLDGRGSLLPAGLRGFFEPRFGRDFSAVRIHIDSPAAESAGQLRARAYTRGHHIAFAAGEYSPQTAAGRRLLAHELAHVVQQGAAPSAASVDGPLRPQLQRASGPQLQRQIIPYGCGPCIFGSKICHKTIVPDDGSCKHLYDDYYKCKC